MMYPSWRDEGFCMAENLIHVAAQKQPLAKDCLWPTVPVRVMVSKLSSSSSTTPADGRSWAARRTYTVGQMRALVNGRFEVGCCHLHLRDAVRGLCPSALCNHRLTSNCSNSSHLQWLSSRWPPMSRRSKSWRGAPSSTRTRSERPRRRCAGGGWPSTIAWKCLATGPQHASSQQTRHSARQASSLCLKCAAGTRCVWLPFLDAVESVMKSSTTLLQPSLSIWRPACPARRGVHLRRWCLHGSNGRPDLSLGAC